MVPTASERGAQSEVANTARWGVPSHWGAQSKVAHKWAGTLHNQYHQGGSPAVQSGGHNHRWPTSGRHGYITCATWNIPSTSKRRAESQLAHKWETWLHNPCRMGIPTTLEPGAEPEVAHKCGSWLHNPCGLGGRHRFRARGAGGNQTWPTSGLVGYITPAAWGVPTASKQGAQSEVAHKWARCLYNPCRLGGPHRFRAGGTIRGHPLEPTWTTCGPRGYITCATWGSPAASEREAESQSAHKWDVWLHNPCRIGIPTTLRRGAEPEVANKLVGWLHNPCRLGCATASKRGAEREVAHKWARWLHNPCCMGIPTTLELGEPQVAHNWGRWLHDPCHLGGRHRFRVGVAESKVAHKWAGRRHNPCRLGGPQHFTAGGRFRGDSQVGQVAT